MFKALEVDIRKRLGEFELKASFNAEGMIHIFGVNGSGKTTLLKCLAGVIRVDSGTIVHNGIELTAIPIEQRKVVYLDRLSFFPNLTVEEHLSFLRVTEVEEIDEIKRIMGIDYKGKLKNLSTGQKLKVSLATSVLSHPRLILLDEISANISNAESTLNDLVPILRRQKTDMINVAQENSQTLEKNFTFNIVNGKITGVED